METSASTAAGKKEGKGAVLEGNGFTETGKKPPPLAAVGAAVAQGGTLFSTIWKQQGCFSLDCKSLISMVASVFLWTRWVYWGSWLSEDLEAVSLRGIQMSLWCDGEQGWGYGGMGGEGWLWGRWGIPSMLATSWLVLHSAGSTVPSTPPWLKSAWRGWLELGSTSLS